MNFSLEAVKMAMIWTFDKIQDGHHSSKIVISQLEKNVTHTQADREQRTYNTETIYRSTYHHTDRMLSWAEEI